MACREEYEVTMSREETLADIEHPACRFSFKARRRLKIKARSER
jgi:hypothetical protein